VVAHVGVVKQPDRAIQNRGVSTPHQYETHRARRQADAGLRLRKLIYRIRRPATASAQECTLHRSQSARVISAMSAICKLNWLPQVSDRHPHNGRDAGSGDDRHAGQPPNKANGVLGLMLNDRVVLVLCVVTDR